MNKLILGTRGSALALWQAEWVTEALGRTRPDVTIERRIIKTEGDIHQDVPIGPGDVGVCVRRIEQALLDREIDFAVHSLKDLPTQQPDELTLAAIPPRHDPRDALLTLDGKKLDELPQGATLATSSLRRRTQLLHHRSDLKVVPLRGNVDTRVRKLREGAFDALVLAVAGVERLEIREVEMRAIDAAVCLPAVGQGALGIEIGRHNDLAREVVGTLNHRTTQLEVDAERSFLKVLGGGCMAPATAYARHVDGGMTVEAMAGDLDGTKLLADRESGSADDAVGIGARLARRLLDAGAGALLAEVRGEDDGPRNS